MSTAIGGLLTVASSQSASAGTVCSQILHGVPPYSFDWSQQWTTLHNNGFVHPGSGCPQDDAYGGWVGIDGAVQTPAHFPYLQGNNSNHSAGWMGILWLSTPAWIQIGWAGGCAGQGATVQCFTPSIGQFDEVQFPNGNYILSNDGTLGYNTTAIYNIQYFPSTSVWKIYDNYNHWLRDVINLPASGTPTVSTEVYNGNTPGLAVEMPQTTFGSSSPTTNAGLRIKGANGWVVWGTNLSSRYTTQYDESTCPNPTWCSSGAPAYAVPYYLSMYYGNYYMAGYGAQR